MKVKSAFEELGFENFEELESKSRLMVLIVSELKRRKLTQAAAGKLLDLDQPNVSALVNEKISRFSVEKLMNFASKLGFAVSIHVEGHGVSVDVPVQSAA
ncbi:MAG TPA: helix-turn-helix transcriptional regulator [Aestuariivirga sp.]